MILAAAECGENPQAEPPPELRLAWQATGYHALPEAGGLLDQPAGLLNRMTAAYNAWQAFDRYRRRDVSKHQQWVEANPELWNEILRIRKLRDEHAQLRDPY